MSYPWDALMMEPTDPIQPVPPVATPEQVVTPQVVKEKERTPEWVIVSLLLTFPPAAWILMWMDYGYHRWFIKILILSGILTIFSAIMFYYTSVPHLTELYASLGVKNENQDAIVMGNFLGILFSILQIFYAFYIRRVLQKNGKLTLLEFSLCIVFLLGNLYVTIVGPFLIMQSIYPSLMKLLGY